MRRTELADVLDAIGLAICVLGLGICIALVLLALLGWIH